MKAVYTLRCADIKDISPIKELLQACDLPVVGIEKQPSDFIIAEAQGNILGILGAVYDGNKALLRSFAVCEKKRGNGIGIALVKAMFNIMKSKEIIEIFLLTETAAAYFVKLEFSEISRGDIPKILLVESGLDQACPCASSCFSYKLVNECKGE